MNHSDFSVENPLLDTQLSAEILMVIIDSATMNFDGHAFQRALTEFERPVSDGHSRCTGSRHRRVKEKEHCLDDPTVCQEGEHHPGCGIRLARSPAFQGGRATSGKLQRGNETRIHQVDFTLGKSKEEFINAILSSFKI